MEPEQGQQVAAQPEGGIPKPEPLGRPDQADHPENAEGRLIDPQTHREQSRLGQESAPMETRPAQTLPGGSHGQQHGCGHQRRIELKREIDQPVGLGEEARRWPAPGHRGRRQRNAAASRVAASARIAMARITPSGAMPVVGAPLLISR